MGIDLKPCPFCGVTDVSHVRHSPGDIYFVACDSCGVEGPHVYKGAVRKTPLEYEAEAAAAWNRRTPPCTPHEEPGGAKDDPHEFGAGILPNPKAKYWQERADFWREKAIELGWREYRDAAQEYDVALSAALAIRGK
jgi:Lar family restriction alleviation protein